MKMKVYCRWNDLNQLIQVNDSTIPSAGSGIKKIEKIGLTEEEAKKLEEQGLLVIQAEEPGKICSHCGGNELGGYTGNNLFPASGGDVQDEFEARRDEWGQCACGHWFRWDGGNNELDGNIYY